MSRAEATSDFVGTHPVQRHSPPSDFFSINATLRPRRAQPDAVTRPAVPPPITTTSKFSDDIHAHFPRSRTIELDQVDALPSSESELAVAIRPCERRADNRRQQMRVGVSFAMFEIPAR